MLVKSLTAAFRTVLLWVLLMLLIFVGGLAVLSSHAGRGGMAGTILHPYKALSPTVTFTVTNTDDSGPGSLRQAILEANASPGADLIAFNIPGAGAHTISPISALPIVTDSVTIDGNTQPGYSGKPLIEVSGAQLSGFVNGLRIAAGNSTVRGLVINRFGASGILLLTNGGDVITGNYLGTNISGTAALSNTVDGIAVASANNRIGGTTSGERNLISGNHQNGVELYHSAATGNVVEGNYIGTDISGTAVLSDSSSSFANGVFTNDAPGNTIGGTLGTTPGGACTGACNLISGNIVAGVYINGNSAGNTVEGNLIGLDANGTAPTSNRRAFGNGTTGIYVAGPNNILGGTTPAARNVIAGSGASGVTISGNLASGNVVEGNYIGTNTDHSAYVANGYGVDVISAPGNQIGGVQGTRPLVDCTGACNYIVGNIVHGVGLLNTASTTNVVEGNTISGASTLSDGPGVSIENAPGNLIGGTTLSAQNLIIYNSMGIYLLGSGTTGNVVEGNYLGTNGRSSVEFGLGASNNTLGGIAPGARNTILDDFGNGVLVMGGTGNAIVRNSIIANRDPSVSSGLGIDLNFDGVTTNDSCDGDTGPNNLQNYPNLTAARSTDTSTTITGTLNSTPNMTYTVEFFSNSTLNPGGFGEGQTFIGSAVITTDSTCNASFVVTVQTGGLGGLFISADATNRSGDTSEFSHDVQAQGSTGGTPTATTTATQTSTATATATQQPVLVGHVVWQGRPTQPNALQQLPVTLTLKLGASTYNYPNMITDPGGFFTATLGALPSGTYAWWVKGPQYLASAGTVGLSSAAVTNLEMGLQKVGDANNDNAIDISDFGILRASFGRSFGQSGYDGRADLDGNNTVDLTDFGLLRGNFGQTGAP